MDEKTILTRYQDDLKNIDEAIKSIDRDLRDFQIEKEKISKYEYDYRWKAEEEKAINYKNSLLSKKVNLEHVLKAYHMAKMYLNDIEKLNALELRDPKEKKELQNDIEHLHELLNKNMELLPSEMQIAISEKTSISELEESDTLESGIEKKSTEQVLKHIEDYRKTIIDANREIKHLEEEIEKLQQIHGTIPEKEYNQELLSLKGHVRRERGKLLRANQVVNCYEIILNNEERLAEIDTINARDEQEKSEIESDRKKLKAEIFENKKFLPKEIFNSIEISSEQKFSSQVLPKLDEIILAPPQEEKNSITDKEKTEEDPLDSEEIADSHFLEKTEEKLAQRQDNGRTLPPEVVKLKNLSLEELQDQYIDLSNKIATYANQENREENQELQQLIEKRNNVVNVINFKGGAIPLMDKKLVSEEEKLETPNFAFQSKKFDNIINNINHIMDSSQSSKEVPSHGTIDDIANRITAGKYSKQKEATPTQSQSPSHSENNPTNDQEGAIIVPPVEPEPQVETSPVEPEPQVETPPVIDATPTSTIVPSETPHHEQANRRPSKKVKNVRKAKKNIAKKIILRIGIVAVTLVLIATGAIKRNGSKNAKRSEPITNEEAIKIFTNYDTEKQTEITSPSETEYVDLTVDDQKTDSSDLINQNVKTTFQTEPQSIEITDDELPEQKITGSNVSEENMQNDNIQTVPSNDVADNFDATFTVGDSINTTSEYTQPESLSVSGNDVRIGSEVSVAGNIYDDEFDALYGENGKTQYFGTMPKRVIVGVGIVNDQGMNVVYAEDNNANQEIQNLINEGGEVVSILTANKEKYLQNYNGTQTLTKEERKAASEGWYNINEIVSENTLGRSM